MARICAARALLSTGVSTAAGGATGCTRAGAGATAAGAAKAARMSSAMRPWKIREKKTLKAYCQRLPWESILGIVLCRGFAGSRFAGSESRWYPEVTSRLDLPQVASEYDRLSSPRTPEPATRGSDHELHDSIEHPALCRAQSGRL